MAPVLLLREFQVTTAALRRTTAALSRAERARACFNTRAWIQGRRTYIRHLVELGGLVQKSGSPERLTAADTEDKHAVILGALLMTNQMLASPHCPACHPSRGGSRQTCSPWFSLTRAMLRRGPHILTGARLPLAFHRD